MTKKKINKHRSVWLKGWEARLDKEMDDVRVEPKKYAKKQKVRPAKRKK